MQPTHASHALSDGDEQLLAALLDGMEAGLCAFDRDGVVTHWNAEAARILGWSAEEAVGRHGFSGWAARSADADAVRVRLLATMESPGRQVHEFALLTKDGRRVLVRTQSAAVHTSDGQPAGVYCAFSEVHTQIDLERSIALSEALFDDASWGVVLIDADLRPAVANAYAARALRTGRDTMLGRPLGELLDRGGEELETVLQHVLASGKPPRGPSDLWVGLRSDPGRRRCWRSGFVRLGSPLGEEPVPLGVGWLFHDVTEEKQTEQETSLLRFRHNQLHRAGRAAAECEDPMEAAVGYLDYALAGFAEYALIDLAQDGPGERGEPGEAGDGEGRLVRVAATPCLPVPVAGIPVPYTHGHPALQAVERIGTVRASFGAIAGAQSSSRAAIDEWAAARRWPEGTAHGLSTALRSRGRTLGAVTFLRGPTRRHFDRADATYAEDVALRIAASVDLAGDRAGGRTYLR